MKRIFLFTFLALSVTLAQAQSSSAGSENTVWSLKQCIEYAMQNNLAIQRSSYSVESATIDYKQSKYALFPTLNLGAAYGYNWGRSLNPVTYEFTQQSQS